MKNILRNIAIFTPIIYVYVSHIVAVKQYLS